MPDADFNEPTQALRRYWSDDFAVESRLGGGQRNQVWQVADVASAERFVLRWSPKQQAAIDWEMGLLVALGDNGCHVPGVIATAEGRRSDDGWTLTRLIEGRRPSSPGDWELVAAELAGVHRATVGYSPCPGAPTIASTEGDGGYGASLAAADRALLLAALDELRSTGGAVSAVHGDPNASNVVIRGHDAFLVDWDEARVDYSCLDFGDRPLAELTAASTVCRRASLAWEILRSVEIEPEYARRRMAEFRAMS